MCTWKGNPQAPSSGQRPQCESEDKTAKDRNIIKLHGTRYSAHHHHVTMKSTQCRYRRATGYIGINLPAALSRIWFSQLHRHFHINRLPDYILIPQKSRIWSTIYTYFPNFVKSTHSLLSYSSQTDRQTNKQTNGVENIASAKTTTTSLLYSSCTVGE